MGKREGRRREGRLGRRLRRSESTRAVADSGASWRGRSRTTVWWEGCGE
jgi:hypothetical protein